MCSLFGLLAVVSSVCDIFVPFRNVKAEFISEEVIIGVERNDDLRRNRAADRVSFIQTTGTIQ